MKNFDDFIVSVDKRAAIKGVSELMDREMETVKIPDELNDLFATFSKAQSAVTARFVTNYLRQYHEWLQDQ